MMRFSRLCLLSTKEGRAFEVDFKASTTILQGPNGHGKSAVAKSLFHALGAVPHKIDKMWQSASVTSLLDFTINDQSFTAVRARDRFVIFDAVSGREILDTTHVGSVLGPFLAKKLDFGLLLSNAQGQLVNPPPSYAFAPFYIDQDGGWQKPWTSFTDFYLSGSRQALSDFHTGRRTNAYYHALAQKDVQQKLIRRLEEERKPLSTAIEEISKLTANLAINLDVSSFEEEIDELASRTRSLNIRQATYREKINNLTSERLVWAEQRSILKLALEEMDKTVVLAAEQPREVDCPTCGHTYHNSIAARFGLISEYDDIFDAIQDGEQAVRRIDEDLIELRKTLGTIEVEIGHIDEILSVRKDDISLGDIISAQGRTETTGVIREKIRGIDALIGEAQARVKEADKALRETSNPSRGRQINSYFERLRTNFSEKLDAKIQEADVRVGAPKIGRGSEGVRELLAYYYAILYCQKEFSSSSFCPIVIDGANQQGQDSHHRKVIYDFLINEKPEGAQLIFTAEEPEITSDEDYELIMVGVKKRQLMDEETYNRVFDRMRPFLDSMI